MINQYKYEHTLNWLGVPGGKHHRDDRSYEILIKGKQSLEGSADKPFFGDSNLYNPENLLLAALSSCYMMSLLYLCRNNKISVLDYKDNAVGNLKLNDDGSGRFHDVTLNVSIKLENPAHNNRVLSLAKEANSLCFIANSVNFDVNHRVLFS